MGEKVLSPASNNSEDLDFDRLTLKIFDPSIEKKYNFFRIKYFSRIIPIVLTAFCILFGIYSLIYYIFTRDNLHSIIRLLVFLFTLCLTFLMRMEWFFSNYYTFTRGLLVMMVLLNFLYFMVTTTDHFTYNFMIETTIMTYNLNLGFIFTLVLGTVHFIFYFCR